DPKVKRHIAKTLVAIPILLLIINPPSTLMRYARVTRRFAARQEMLSAEGTVTELAKVTGRETSELSWRTGSSDSGIGLSEWVDFFRSSFQKLAHLRPPCS